MTPSDLPHFLGIEIGGTKLQVGVGPDDGKLRGLWRGTVNPAAGAEGIRRQISTAIPELLAQSGIERSAMRGVGIGFGGPVDDATRTVIKSHHIEGWDGFPLADWLSDLVELPAILGNDADVAGLAEALHGAGKGLSPIFYVTVGTGIGGGLIIDGEIYRGVGRGAAEIGHLRNAIQRGDVWDVCSLESISSGRGIERLASELASLDVYRDSPLSEINAQTLSVQDIGRAASAGDDCAWLALNVALGFFADALCHVIALLCPARIVVGGGVSLLGEDLFFAPLRSLVANRAFRSFADLTDIVPAALGEEVVVHGAITLARKNLA